MPLRVLDAVLAALSRSPFTRFSLYPVTIDSLDSDTGVLDDLAVAFLAQLFIGGKSRENTGCSRNFFGS